MSGGCLWGTVKQPGRGAPTGLGQGSTTVEADGKEKKKKKKASVANHCAPSTLVFVGL